MLLFDVAAVVCRLFLRCLVFALLRVCCCVFVLFVVCILCCVVVVASHVMLFDEASTRSYVMLLSHVVRILAATMSVLLMDTCIWHAHVRV